LLIHGEKENKEAQGRACVTGTQSLNSLARFCFLFGSVDFLENSLTIYCFFVSLDVKYNCANSVTLTKDIRMNSRAVFFFLLEAIRHWAIVAHIVKFAGGAFLTLPINHALAYQGKS
jgi:hypothetical protein